MYKNKDKSGEKWKVFIKPFRWEVWLCILLSIILTSTLLWAMIKIVFFAQPTTKQLLSHQFGESAWHIIGAIFQQGISIINWLLFNIK